MQVLNLTYPSDHRLVRATFLHLSSNKSSKTYGNNVKGTLKTKEEIQIYKETLKRSLERSTAILEQNLKNAQGLIK